MDWLLQLLPWITPPVIGAAIGYITNDIAIRMLFRPLKEMRIFGIKVPFTPGIIPKQRYELAESIGNMVSRELITGDAIKNQLELPAVRESVRNQVSGLTQGILDVRLEDMAEKDIPFLSRRLPDLLESILSSFLSGRTFHEVAEGVIRHFVGRVSALRLKDLIRDNDLEGFLSQKLQAMVTDPGFREKLASVLTDWAARHVQSNSQLSVFITPDVSDIATHAFRALLPLLEKALVSWFATPDVRRELEIKGKLLLDDILAKLNLIQRFFLSVGQYDRTLGDKMPEIIDSLIAYLEQLFASEENRETIVGAFSKAVSDFKKKKIKSVLKEQGIDPREKIAELVPSFMDFLDRNRIAPKLAAGIASFLVGNAEETLGEAAKRTLGITLDEATSSITGFITTPRFAEDASRAITGYVVEFLKTKGDRTIGGFFSVSDETKQDIDDRACKALFDVLATKVPEAIASLDIKSMVVDKINALDVKSVENLLLMVIAKHLKWINVFGAILGGIIGFTQVVLNIFM